MNNLIPEKIICITEETTETIYLLGEEKRLIGISGFTKRPKIAKKQKQVVSTFLDADIEKIIELEPDLVIGFSDIQSSIAEKLIKKGVTVLINNYSWLAGTPRAHITNQRTMEVLRDLGKEVEAEAYLHATEQDLMGENIFCTSLAGEELGRMKSWGKHPNSRAEHLLSSPSFMNDLPQTFMEPLLYKTACSRGTQSRMSTQYLSHIEDEEGVLSTCLDKLSNKEIKIRSKYFLGNIIF